VGDTIDWWRVEEVEPESLLRLRAEMRLPGLAWLDLRVESDDDERTVFRQVAYFHPRGLLGQLYWWAVTPFHGFVFGGMQRNIARAAEAHERRGAPDGGQRTREPADEQTPVSPPVAVYRQGQSTLWDEDGA
jgi:hypothetical protein